MSKNIKTACVIGHFGFGHNLLNGQTVKTKILTEELEKSLPRGILKIDTHGGIKSLIKAPFHVFRALKECKNVIILPAHNGLRVYAPMLSFIRRFFRGRKLYYAVIGGWLPPFLESRKGLARKLKKFDGIYVETHTMKLALEEQGFDNVFVMPNCKELKILSPDDLHVFDTEPYKLCTFSRVMKEKGIEDAVNAVKAANDRLGRTAYCLDIFGQVDEGQTEWFEELKKSFPEYVRYGGLVPFDKSVEVLKDYFALLFPTYYDGEGFAGTVLDAYAAGIAVIASDWKYNTEIVCDGKTGLIFRVRDVEMLTDKLLYLYHHTDKLKEMKLHCLNEAQKYQPSKVFRILFDRLDGE